VVIRGAGGPHTGNRRWEPETKKCCPWRKKDFDTPGWVDYKRRIVKSMVADIVQEIEKASDISKTKGTEDPCLTLKRIKAV